MNGATNTGAKPVFSRGYLVSLALVTASLLVPLWLVSHPPLSDYLNHLARAEILAHRSEVPLYRELYAPAWGPYPNLAFDLVVVPLARVLPVGVAGKLFLSTTVLVWCAGCVLLGAALVGRASARALVACCFVYNESFLLGYANFTFGLGLAFIALALFVRGGWAPSRRRSIGLALLGVVVVVSHAAAFVTFAMSAVAITGALHWQERRTRPFRLRELASKLWPLAAGALYFLAWLALFADHSADRGFSSPGTSVRLILRAVLPSYSERFDHTLFLVVVASAALAILLHGGRPPIDRRAAAATSILVTAVFVAPADFAGGYEANGRYAIGAWVMALFVIDTGEDLGIRSLRDRLVGQSPVWITLAALVVRQALVVRAFRELDRDVRAELSLFEQLTEGTHLGNLTFLDGRASPAEQLRQRAVLHATSVAAITRQAHVPTLYAIPGVQPMRHLDPRYDKHRFRLGDEGPFEVERIKAELDAAMLCRAPPVLREALLEGGGRSSGRAGDCELLRWR